YLARAKSARVIVSERDEVDAAGTKLLEQIDERYRAALEQDEGAPPPSDLLADWDFIESRLAQATALAQLGLDDDANPQSPISPQSAINQSAINPQSAIRNPQFEALPSRPIRCQPIAELRGRIPDWVSEIRRLRDAGETTLFVAATAGRAER